MIPAVVEDKGDDGELMPTSRNDLRQGTSSKIRDNRRVLRITIWKSFEGKRFRGRPTIETIARSEMNNN